MEDYLNENFGNVKPKNSPDNALQRWKKLCWVVKNPKRRFRFTANLAKRFEAEAIRRSSQEETENNEEEAEALLLPDTSISAEIAEALLRPNASTLAAQAEAPLQPNTSISAEQAQALLRSNGKNAGAGITSTFFEEETENNDKEAKVLLQPDASISEEIAKALLRPNANTFAAEAEAPLQPNTSTSAEQAEALLRPNGKTAGGGKTSTSFEKEIEKSDGEEYNPPCEFQATGIEGQDVLSTRGSSRTTEDRDIESGSQNPPTKGNYGLIFALGNVILEAISLVFEQLSSPKRPWFAFVWMVLSYVAMALWIGEFVYRLKSEGAQLRRVMVSMIQMVGALFAVVQACFSTIEYIYDSKHSRNPIKVSLFGLIIAIVIVLDIARKYQRLGTLESTSLPS